MAGIMGITSLKAKLSDARNYLIAGNNSRTSGLIFAYGPDNSYCIASYSWTYGSDGTFKQLAGDLTLSRINEYGSVVVEGATAFAAIYFDM